MIAPTMTFVFPLPPNLANARMHWRVKENHRQAYMAACDTLQLTRQLPAPPAQPFPKVTLKETLYVGSEMDDDNAAARCKWPVDWLKTRGYIADDKRKNVRRVTYPDQRVKRDKNYRVEITLTALEVAKT